MAVRMTNATRTAKQYQNADGPGGSTVDYGPRQGMGQRDIYDQRREQYGNSPWYGRNGESSPMPWAGPPGQERGVRAPFFTPDAADPRNAGYFAPEDHSMDAAIAQAHAANRGAYNADAAYSQAAGAGDLKSAIARMIAMKQQAQQDRFVAQGGTPETWGSRFQQAWPVPGMAPPTGAPPTGGGRTMLPPTGGRMMPPAATQAMSGGVSPMQNPMMQGYMGGGAGVSSGPGGWGSRGGMPMGNPNASMGGGETGMMYPGGASPMGYNPNAGIGDFMRMLQMSGYPMY